MMPDFPHWWQFLTYDGFKSDMNFTDGLKYFAEDRIKVGKNKTKTRVFNQLYDKFQ